MTYYSELVTSLSEVTKFRNGEPSNLKVTEIRAPEVNVREIRSHIGLTQEQFAEEYGFSVGTVKNWEQGARAPEGPARILLGLIQREPEVLREKIRALRAV